jgi:hypothetical protein
MSGYSYKHSRKIRVFLIVVILCTSCLLEACSLNSQPPAHPPVNKSSRELPDYDTYSWARDAGFSNLDPAEQLERITAASFQQDGSQVTLSAVKTTSNGDTYAVGQIATVLGNLEDDNVLLQSLIVKYDNDLKLTGYLIDSDSAWYNAVVVYSNSFIYVLGHRLTAEFYGGYIIKYDMELNEVCRRLVPEMGFRSAVITTDGCLLLCGGSRTSAVFAKYDIDLELLDLVDVTDDRFGSLEMFVIGSDSSVYAIGQTAPTPSGFGQSAVIMKYDSSFVLQKTVIKHEREDTNRFTALAIGPDDFLYVAFEATANYVPNPITGQIIKYDANLTECGSLYLPDVYQTYPEYLPANNLPYAFNVVSLIADRNGFLYCIGSLNSFSLDNVAVVLLDGDLAVMNSAVWSIDGRVLFTEYAASLADDGTLFIVGTESYPRPQPLDTTPPVYVRVVIFK